MNISFIKSTFKHGVIMGLGFCLYTTLMWLTKLDTTYLNIGQFLDIAIILLPIGMIFWAIRQEIKSYNISVFQRIGIAVFVSLVSFIIYDPFLYAYHHYINPEWFNAVTALKEVELIASNIPQNEITAELEKMRASNIAQAGLFRLGALIPSVIILPTLIAFLSMVFIRRRSGEIEVPTMG